MAMLTSLPCRWDPNIVPPQLCPPPWVHCVLCAAATDTMEEPESNAAQADEMPLAQGTGVKESSSHRRPVRKPCKYGRCFACQSARRPWIYQSGPRAGQAALVCGKLFEKKGKKCFVFEIMSSEQLSQMPIFFPETTPELGHAPETRRAMRLSGSDVTCVREKKHRFAASVHVEIAEVTVHDAMLFC